MTTMRLLFYNTFLLRLRMPWPGGGLELAGKSACRARATEIGRSLAGRYDIVALCEAFDEDDRQAVLAGWRGRGASHAVGPGRSLFPPALKSSGLLTVVDGLPIVRHAAHRFGQRGSYWRDADAFSNKGVLLAEVDAGGAGNVEVYSTHLVFGNDLAGKRPGDPYRLNAGIRQQQVAELLEFVGRTHRPENMAVILGDFNVPAGDPSADPTDPDYARLVEAMNQAGFDDCWAAYGKGDGFTHCFGGPVDAVCEADPDAPDCCLEPAVLRPGARAARIDYAWLQRPAAEHRIEASVVALRRRAFPRRPGAEGYAALAFMSDHLALHMEMSLRPRQVNAGWRAEGGEERRGADGGAGD